MQPCTAGNPGPEGQQLVVRLSVRSRSKVGIVALHRPGDDGWLAEDRQNHFDERAGTAEFIGGLP